MQPRVTWQETVEADRTRTDFKDMGTMRSPNRRTGSVVGDPLLAMAEEDIRILAAQAQSQAVVDTRALISGERRGDSPHHELSGLYLIPSPPSSHPLRQLLYSRLRLCVLRAQMSLLDERARHHRNSRYAGVHYKHIP